MLFVPSFTHWASSQVAVVHDGIVNLFLFRKGETIIAIDSGYRANRIRRALRRLKVAPEQVTHLFLTHSDFDHAGAVQVFPHAQLYMGEAERPLVEQKIPRFRHRFNAPLTRPVTPIADGALMEVGGVQVRAIALPGHTPGSTGWLVEGTHLFAGDAVMLTLGKVHAMPAFNNMDHARYRETLHALAARILAAEGTDPLRTVKCVFTAHSGYTVAAREAFGRL